MGNHLCYAKPSKTRADAKVIRCDDGGIEEFRESIMVGELMVDNPHQFVCDFSGLQAGCRITALRAEEDLVLGGVCVYLLLPMQKYLRCVLSPSDMASLNLLALQCNSGQRKLSCNSRIFPAILDLSDFSSMDGRAERSDQLKAKVAGRLVVPKLELDEDENRSTGLGFGLSQHRIPGFRYWKPALETIKESPRVRKTV